MEVRVAMGEGSGGGEWFTWLPGFSVLVFSISGNRHINAYRPIYGQWQDREVKPISPSMDVSPLIAVKSNFSDFKGILSFRFWNSQYLKRCQNCQKLDHFLLENPSYKVKTAILSHWSLLFTFKINKTTGIPEDQWSCETLTWYLDQAQNKIWFKMAQSFLRKFVWFDALRPSKQLWSCRDVTSNFMGLLPDIEMKWHLKPCTKHHPSKQLRLLWRGGLTLSHTTHPGQA